MNRKKTTLLVVATLILAVLALLRPLRFFDNIWYDLCFALAPRDASGAVVVVGLDSKSIELFGALPWSRSTMAALVEKINQGRPAAIALDFLFPRRGGTAENDSLAAVFSRTTRLVLPFRADDIEAVPDAVIQPVPSGLFPYRIESIDRRELLDDIGFYAARTVSAADTLFTPYARWGGFLNVSTSSSSQKLREAIQVIRVGNEYFPSFGIAAVAAWSGVSQVSVTLSGAGVLHVGNLRVPISSYAASTAINFRSEKAQVPTVSAAAVFDGSYDVTQFAGKLVFVGVIDPAATSDFFTTPLSSQFPGVTVWATTALDIIEKAILHAPSWPLGLCGVVLMFLIFPGCALLFPATKRRSALVATTALVIAGFCISVVLFRMYFTVWNFPPVMYAWLFLLLWLAALRADAALAGPVNVNFDLSNLPPEAFPRPPAPDDLADHLPPTATSGYITKLLAASAATTSSDLSAQKDEPGTLSGTIVEVDREALAPQPRPKAMAENIQVLPRDLAGGTIVRLIGSGGMADVYQVWHQRLETYRAVKVMKPGCNDNFLARFETEIRIIAKLDHPNIVRCYNVGEWHTLPFLEMEFVYGASLEEVLAKCKVLTIEQALIVGTLVCRALHYAHNQVLSIYGKTYRGIVHRDLKPANIMLSRSGQIKLTDFGIARPAAVSLHTMDAGSVVGTLPYLAPEQLEKTDLTASADIYALGATLYELIAGERAFAQTEIPALLRAKSFGTYKPLTRTAQVPVEIAEIIDTAMATEPARRFPTSLAFGKALEGALVKRCGHDGATHLSILVKRTWDIG